MGVVTVSASFGAGGAEIAPAVAELLGLPFHDRVIPAQVAGRLGVPVAQAEANDETITRGLWRLVSSLGTMPDPVGGVLPTWGLPDERAYRVQTERVLGEIADGPGGVVLGRAAAMVLRGRPDVLHVRLDGPADRRLAAAVQHTGRPEDEVRRERDAVDAGRVAYVRHFYRCDPADARHYHLVVDSTALSHEVVVDLVVTAARAQGIGFG
jgi:cytidylate kinase-like protein